MKLDALVFTQMPMSVGRFDILNELLAKVMKNVFVRVILTRRMFVKENIKKERSIRERAEKCYREIYDLHLHGKVSNDLDEESVDLIYRFAQELIAETKERCAQVAEEQIVKAEEHADNNGYEWACRDIAQAIRESKRNQAQFRQ